MATLGQGGDSEVIYLAVSNGKLVQRLSDDANIPGMVKRELTFGPNIGKIVNELRYSNTKGFITNLEIKTNEFNGNTITSLNISLDDNIQVQFNDKQMANVTNSLLNADFSKEFKVSAYLKNDKNAFSFEQDGEWLSWKVTKANPMDCPAPTEKTVKGVKKWDFSDREEWFYGKLEELIMVNFPNGRITTPSGASYSETHKAVEIQKPTEDEEISVEDIPFS